ncbi:MAG: hypothetical protein M1835_007226 [Candelina submexicana]|nr:MAG: hypothetical protein M1835_007226 [Candelina submexicana]
MPLSSQFSITVELTKLVPLVPVLNAGFQAAVTIARDLRKSHSDFVVEEDLAVVLGKNRISAAFETRFRELIKTSNVQQLAAYLDVVLESGAGPTVRRSLNDSRYFSTVLQLSLLAWTHEISSLATSLAEAFRRRGSPLEIQDTPTRDGIEGSLQACREQTAAFCWYPIFSEVERKFASHRPSLSDPRRLPFEVLQGFLDFLFAVQTLPDDRLIHIITGRGYSTIVVWAHYALGLNVIVNIHDQGFQFGEGKPQVIVECDRTPVQTTSVYLLAADSEEEVFHIQRDGYRDPELNEDFRVPAFGYGSSVIESFVGSDEAVILELAHRVIVNCWSAAVDLSDDYPAEEDEITQRGLYKRLSNCSKRRIFEVGCFLFGDLPVTLDDVIEAAKGPRFIPLLPKKKPDHVPSSILSWLHRWYPDHTSLQDSTSDRSPPMLDLSGIVNELSCVLFAFTAVHDLDGFRDLPLCRAALSGHRVRTANLIDHIAPTIDLCNCNELYNILARLLVGSKMDENLLKKASLVSSWGWSIYLPAIGAVDPAQIQPGIVKIARGVPSRYGERKSWIIDGPNSKSMGGMYPFERIGSTGEISRLRCANTTRRPQAFAGPNGNAFETTVELFAKEHPHHRGETFGFGYRRFSTIRWGVDLLPGCPHRHKEDAQLVLPEDTSTFSGYGRDRARKHRINLGLTSNDPTSRWLLMEGTYSHAKYNNSCIDGAKTPLLRGDNCCFECALEYAKQLGRIVYVIL